MKPKTCGECEFFERAYGRVGFCRGEDIEDGKKEHSRQYGPCRWITLLRACHKQRDRARKAEAELQRVAPYLAVHGFSGYRFEPEVVSTTGMPENQVLIVPPPRENETLEQLARRSKLIKLGEEP